MLTPGIFQAYENGVEKLSGQSGLKQFGQRQAGTSDACASRAALFKTDAKTFLVSKALEDEIFGLASLAIKSESFEQVLAVAEHVERQLTATLQLDAGDEEQAHALLPMLERKAGRILANGYPTGVEVSHAIVHGGPFLPPPSNAAFTSVGATAIDRFLRLVCYQDISDSLLPDALQESTTHKGCGTFVTAR